MRALRFVACAGLAAAGCGGDDPLVQTEPIVCGGADGGDAPCVDVRFVAHQDDDLLFMNPDVAASIAAGNAVTTVYLTAGTRSDVPYLVARETGILNAYAYMVDPTLAVTERADEPALFARWSLHGAAPIAIGTHAAIQYDFTGAIPAGGSLAVVFLRMTELDGVEDLEALEAGDTPTVATVGCADDCELGSALPAQRYTRAELVDVLEALMTRSEAAAPGALVVSTLDATQLFHRAEAFGIGWVDNADHIATAKLVTAAFVRHGEPAGRVPPALVQYRGYDIGREPANLGDQELEKRRTFYRYFRLGEANEGPDADGHVVPYSNADPEDPRFFENRGYVSWPGRRYAVTTAGGETAAPLATGGECLRLGDDGTLVLGACGGATLWVRSDANAVRAATGSACLAATLDADDVRAEPCPDAASPADTRDVERRTFLFTSTGQIRGRDARCLERTATGVRLAPCAQRVDGAGDPTGQPIAAQAWSWTP